MIELKSFEGEAEAHESGTESDKDAREAKVCKIVLINLFIMLDYISRHTMILRNRPKNEKKEKKIP